MVRVICSFSTPNQLVIIESRIYIHEPSTSNPLNIDLLSSSRHILIVHLANFNCIVSRQIYVNGLGIFPSALEVLCIGTIIAADDPLYHMEQFWFESSWCFELAFSVQIRVAHECC